MGAGLQGAQLEAGPVVAVKLIRKERLGNPDAVAVPPRDPRRRRARPPRHRPLRRRRGERDAPARHGVRAGRRSGPAREGRRTSAGRRRGWLRPAGGAGVAARPRARPGASGCQAAQPAAGGEPGRQEPGHGAARSAALPSGGESASTGTEEGVVVGTPDTCRRTGLGVPGRGRPSQPVQPRMHPVFPARRPAALPRREFRSEDSTNTRYEEPAAFERAAADVSPAAAAVVRRLMAKRPGIASRRRRKRRDRPGGRGAPGAPEGPSPRPARRRSGGAARRLRYRGGGSGGRPPAAAASPRLRRRTSAVPHRRRGGPAPADRRRRADPRAGPGRRTIPRPRPRRPRPRRPRRRGRRPGPPAGREEGRRRDRADLGDPDGPSTGFRVERAADPYFTKAVSAVTVGAVQSYTDDRLAAGAIYYYRVRAWRPSGESPVSDAAWPPPDYADGFTAAGLQLNGGAAVVGLRLRLSDLKPNETRSASTGRTGHAGVPHEVPLPHRPRPVGRRLHVLPPGRRPDRAGPGQRRTRLPGHPRQRGREVSTCGTTPAKGRTRRACSVAGRCRPTPARSTLRRSGIDLHSGRAYDAAIDYKDGKLTLQITDATDPRRQFTTTFDVDLQKTVGDKAYVGFTAGTGGVGGAGGPVVDLESTRPADKRRRKGGFPLSWVAWAHTTMRPCDPCEEPPARLTPRRSYGMGSPRRGMGGNGNAPRRRAASGAIGPSGRRPWRGYAFLCFLCFLWCFLPVFEAAVPDEF